MSTTAAPTTADPGPTPDNWRERILFRSDFDVVLLDSFGDDQTVCQAARVSNLGAAALDTKESQKLVDFLLGKGHGSPLEHVYFRWLVRQPIFSWREFYRHRIANYSEQSSRWMFLEPEFYLPHVDRPLVQQGRKGDYDIVVAPNQVALNHRLHERKAAAALAGYDAYMEDVRDGVAPEAARISLSVNTYSSAWVTMNVRALCNFLMLRTDPTAQWEIRQVANAMEEHFRLTLPMTHGAWVTAGRNKP